MPEAAHYRLETPEGVVHNDLTPEEEEGEILRITTNPWKPEEVERARKRLIALRNQLRTPVTEMDIGVSAEVCRSLAKLVDPKRLFPDITIRRVAKAMRVCAAASDAEEYFGVIEVSERFVTIAKLPWILGSHKDGTRTSIGEERDYFMLLPR